MALSRKKATTIALDPEADRLLSRAAMQAFMQDLARGAFTYAPPTIGQLSRAMQVDRHFAAVRLRDGRPFELVVHPTVPDS